jgi:uncharacterized protein (TIGR03085 family)
MAAHLVLRERDPLAALGLVVPGPWSRFARRRQDALAGTDFEGLLATVRGGPPRGFFNLGWVRRLANLNELFVHHEDVRRANGLGPRVLPPGEDAALFCNVTRSARLLSRHLRGVGLEVEWAETGKITRARRGRPVARLTGAPGGADDRSPG